MFSPFRALVLRPAAAARRLSRSARSILEDDSIPVDLSEDNDAVNGVRSPALPLTPTPPAWQAHRQSLRHSFPDGWNPPRKLSREAMDGLRQLHRVDPATFTTPVLAERFRISPEAVRRILKSRWEPPPQQRTKLLKREAQAKAQFRSLSSLRERMEARRVLESKSHLRAAKNADVDWDARGDAPARGVHPADRLTFE
ncbi:hypothetical protein B0H11DRAFT_1946587 [Mycena galericulata]|nr:hypothetical protein B0H11DRAFT_1946587 [Mycena galericulata]